MACDSPSALRWQLWDREPGSGYGPGTEGGPGGGGQVWRDTQPSPLPLLHLCPRSCRHRGSLPAGYRGGRGGEPDSRPQGELGRRAENASLGLGGEGKLRNIQTDVQEERLEQQADTAACNYSSPHSQGAGSGSFTGEVEFQLPQRSRSHPHRPGTSVGAEEAMADFPTLWGLLTRGSSGRLPAPFVL